MSNRLIKVIPIDSFATVTTKLGIINKTGNPSLVINENGDLVSGEIIYAINGGEITVTYVNGNITIQIGDSLSTFKIQFEAGTFADRTVLTLQSAPCTATSTKPVFIPIFTANEVVRRLTIQSDGSGGDTKLVQFLKTQPIEAFNQQKINLRIDFYQAILDANPMNLASRFTDSEISRMNGLIKNLDGDALFFKGDPRQVQKNEAYLELLNQAKVAIDDCARKVANIVDGKADAYIGATQVGAFGLNLEDTLNNFYETYSSPANRKKLEDARKATLTKPPAAPTEGPIVSVNPSLSELEATQARAQADNQIIFVSGSSGVNLFTNPAGDPTNVYTILDIMRDEQSAFIFESTAVIITDQPNIKAIGDSQCEKVLGKLTPKQLLALIKTVKDQIDYNNRLLDRLQLLTNKIKNSGSFNLSRLWNNFPDVKFSFGKSPGGRGPILDAIEKAAKTAYTSAKKSGQDAGKQLLDSAVTMADEASKDIQGVAKFITNTLTEDTADILKNVKDNAAALKGVLDSLTDADKSLCSSLNDVAKIANAPQMIQSSIDKTRERAKRDADKIIRYTQQAKAITESQNKLSNLAQNFAKALVKK
jgi:hypothetical protein